MLVDRDPAEVIARLGVAPGCKVALGAEFRFLEVPLRIHGCRVVPARVPVPNANLTLLVTLEKHEVPGLAVFAHRLAEVSALWVALPRRSVEVEGLPPPDRRPCLQDLQEVFIPLGLTDDKLLSLGTMLVGYRFVRKGTLLRAEGGPDDDLDLLEEKRRRARKPRPRAQNRE